MSVVPAVQLGTYVCGVDYYQTVWCVLVSGCRCIPTGTGVAAMRYRPFAGLGRIEGAKNTGG